MHRLTIKSKNDLNTPPTLFPQAGKNKYRKLGLKSGELYNIKAQKISKLEQFHQF